MFKIGDKVRYKADRDKRIRPSGKIIEGIFGGYRVVFDYGYIRECLEQELEQDTGEDNESAVPGIQE